jgi:hypothetical protein
MKLPFTFDGWPFLPNAKVTTIEQPSAHFRLNLPMTDSFSEPSCNARATPSKRALSADQLNIYTFIYTEMSRDSAVGIATGYRAGQQRGRSSSTGRVKNSLFYTSSRPVMGPIQPPIHWVPGTLSPGVKPGHEADHSPSTRAEVKKMWIYICTSPYAFMA